MDGRPSVPGGREGVNTPLLRSGQVFKCVNTLSGQVLECVNTLVWPGVKTPLSVLTPAYYVHYIYM